MGFVDEERVELCGERETCFFCACVECVRCSDDYVAASCEAPGVRCGLQPLGQAANNATIVSVLPVPVGMTTVASRVASVVQ